MTDKQTPPLAAEVRGDLMRFSMGAPTIDRENILDLCDLYERAVIERAELRALLRRLYEWDHMDSAADGDFWRGEIDKALGRDKDG